MTGGTSASNWGRKGYLLGLIGLAGIAVTVGCGGGGGGGSTSGSGTGSGGTQFPDRGGGESSQPPPSVQTARLAFDSATGEKCCVAIDASLIPGGAILVLDDLPAGPGTVTVDFFAEDFAPALDGVTLTCQTNPPSAGSPCDPLRVASPSFRSEPQQVTIVPGVQTDVADLVITALPFVLDFTPRDGELTPNPVQFNFTVADAVTDVRADSIVLEITVQIPDGPTFRPLTKRLPLTLSPCDDSTQAQCSPAGALDLAGFQANSAPTTLTTGPVDVRILALNDGDPTQAVDFTYAFEVVP